MQDPNPTARQQRNTRWLASHPGTVASVGAVLFGAIGVAYGALADDEVGWLNPVVGGAIGLVLGAVLGWCVSEGSRERRPRGVRLVLYGIALAVCFGVVVGMRHLRYST